MRNCAEEGFESKVTTDCALRCIAHCLQPSLGGGVVVHPNPVV